MTVLVSPFGPKPQMLLSTGLPAVGNKLFFYVAGSVGTKQNTYTSSTGGSANANPIILNSLGEPTNEIWFTSSQIYKVVYAPSTDTDPPASPIWTIDNLSGINDTTVTQDQWLASGLTPTYVSATSFTLAGDQTSNFQVGRRVKSTVTAGTSVGTITGSTFGAVTTVTVDTTGSNPIDSGISAVSYGLLTKLLDAIPRGIFLTVPNIRSYLAGLTMSTAGGSATMSVAAGVAADSTNVSMLTLAAISKTTASWTVGTGNGGLDTGSIANTTTYHFYVITRLDTSVVDVLFSLSATAPTMPANYTLFRRIGSMRTNGAAQWTSFTQDGDLFELWVPVNDVTTVNPGTSAVTATLTSIPTGVNVLAKVVPYAVDTTPANTAGLLSDLAITDTAPTASIQNFRGYNIGSPDGQAAELQIRTNTSAQIRYRLSASTANLTIKLTSFGWIDRRGRDA